MAEGASIQSRGARYFDARVLLLSWEVADKRFDEELGHLERTFKGAYNFSTCRYKILNEDSYDGLTTSLRDFLTYDDPETLLIVYYGGHGYSNTDNHLLWSLYGDGDPSVDWTCLQQPIFSKQSDFLILLDCCTAASVIGERQRGRVEALLGCGIQDRTPISGDHCFTRRLSKMLRSFAQNGGIEVYELYHRLYQEYNKSGPDRSHKGKEPAYLKPGRDLRRSIWLRPMDSFYDAKSVAASARRSLLSCRTVRTSHTVEAIGAVEAFTGDRGDNFSVTSVRTMHYSLQDEDDMIPKIPGDAVVQLEIPDEVSPRHQAHSQATRMEIESSTGSRAGGLHETGTGSFSSEDVLPKANESSPSSIETDPLAAVAQANLRVIQKTLGRTDDYVDRDHYVGYKRQRITRILNELSSLQHEMQDGVAPGFFTVSPISEDNFLEWQATLKGPLETPYEGGIFHVRLSVTDIDYPFCPPRVWFHTRIYHPNIDRNTGAICANHLKFPEERRREQPTVTRWTENEPGPFTIQVRSSSKARTPPDDPDPDGWTSWSPVYYTFQRSVLALYVLLSEPGLTDPLEPEIARQAEEDPEVFERMAREWTELYATGSVQ